MSTDFDFSAFIGAAWPILELFKVNLQLWSFWRAVIFILGAPLGWNILGRLEYHTKVFSTMFKSKFVGCYFFAAYIFIFSIFRDVYFVEALHEQAKITLPAQLQTAALVATAALYVFGGVLVVTSSWSLGILGTYNGDYFGLLMTERLTNFPFSVFENPMYVGSTSLFLARALHELSPTGVLLSVWVWVVYNIGIMFESPFTSYIYSQAALDQEVAKDASSVRNAARHLARRLPGGDPDSWSVDDVTSWLVNVAEMPGLATVFAQHDVDGSVLFRLDMAMLQHDLGIESLGRRFKLLDAINASKNAHTQSLKDSQNNEWIRERKLIEEKFMMTVDQKLLSPVRRRVDKAKAMARRIRGKGRSLNKEFDDDDKTSSAGSSEEVKTPSKRKPRATAKSTTKKSASASRSRSRSRTPRVTRARASRS